MFYNHRASRSLPFGFRFFVVHLYVVMTYIIINSNQLHTRNSRNLTSVNTSTAGWIGLFHQFWQLLFLYFFSNFSSSGHRCELLLKTADISSWQKATMNKWETVDISSWQKATMNKWETVDISSWQKATMNKWETADISSWQKATMNKWETVDIPFWQKATMNKWETADIYSPGRKLSWTRERL